MQEKTVNVATVRGNSQRFSSVSSLVSSNGGADGIRTHDLLDAIEARSQLRHGPTGQKQLNPFYITTKAASMRSSLSKQDVRLEYGAYGKTHFSGRGGMRYGFQISGRSGGQTAAGGLWNFLGLARTSGAPIQTAVGCTQTR